MTGYVERVGVFNTACFISHANWQKRELGTVDKITDQTTILLLKETFC